MVISSVQLSKIFGLVLPVAANSTISKQLDGGVLLVSHSKDQLRAAPSDNRFATLLWIAMGFKMIGARIVRK